MITNFPHGTREALRLGYEEVSGWNRRVINADITGFGDAGPDARLPYGVIQSPAEAAVDPQLRAADIVVPLEGRLGRGLHGE